MASLGRYTVCAIVAMSAGNWFQADVQDGLCARVSVYTHGLVKDRQYLCPPCVCAGVGRVWVGMAKGGWSQWR